MLAAAIVAIELLLRPVISRKASSIVGASPGVRPASSVVSASSGPGIRVSGSRGLSSRLLSVCRSQGSGVFSDLQLDFFRDDPLSLGLGVDVFAVLDHVLGLLRLHLGQPQFSLDVFFVEDLLDVSLDAADAHLRVGQLFLGDLLRDELVFGGLQHFLEVLELFFVHDGDAGAGLACACRPTDSVDVAGEFGRELEVDDELQVLDVEAAGCEVCREHDVVLHLAEVFEGLHSLELRHVAVQLADLFAEDAEQRGDAVAVSFCFEEDDAAFCDFVFDQVDDCCFAVVGVLDEDHLLREQFGDAVVGVGLHAQRLRQGELDERLDLFIERRAEEQRLSRFGHVLDDGLDLCVEAHGQQLVCFVEDQDLEVVQVEALGVFDQVGDAAGSRDDDVRASADLCFLFLDLRLADDQRVGQVGELVQLRESLVALQRQLSRGTDDQRLGVVAQRHAVLQLVELLDYRQQEGRGFARTGHRAGQDVSAAGDQRDGHLLDECRVQVLLLVDCSEQRFYQAERLPGFRPERLRLLGRSVGWRLHCLGFWVSEGYSGQQQPQQCVLSS